MQFFKRVNDKGRGKHFTEVAKADAPPVGRVHPANENLATLASVASLSLHHPTGPVLYNNTVEPCIMHFPTMDLSTHVKRDEICDPMSGSLYRKLKAEKKTKSLRFPKPKYTVCLDKNHDNHALLTRCCRKSFMGNVNQDRVMLVKHLALNNSGGPDRCLLFGAFDGHGPEGNAVAHHAVIELPRILTQNMQQENMSMPLARELIQQAITDTFLQIDASIPSSVAESSGSTGVVVLQIEQHLYVAHAGDSGAFVAVANDGNATDIIYCTEAHKPHHELERARIEKLGGVVIMPPKKEDVPAELVELDLSSRVVLPAKNFALATSRSIGDAAGKAVGVIAEPSIHVLDVDQLMGAGKHIFALAGSDGLFDMITPQQLANHVGEALKAGRPLLEAAEQLVMKASELWRALGGNYRDDISIVVTRLLIKPSKGAGKFTQGHPQRVTTYPKEFK